MDKTVDKVMHEYYNETPITHNLDSEYYGVNKTSPYYRRCIVLYPNLFIADVTTSNIREGQNMNKRSIKMKWKLDLYDM